MGMSSSALNTGLATRETSRHLKTKRTMWPTHAQVVYLERLSAETANRRWLEIGCGRVFIPAWMPQHQRLGRVMIQQARHAVGLDPFEDSLQQNDWFENKVCAFVEAMPFEDASFDLVSANMVAEHLEKPQAALREIYRVLAPGGKLIFHTPNFAYPLTRLSAWLPDRVKVAAARRLESRAAPDVFPTHYRLNRVDDIERLASLAGFRCVEIEPIDSVPMLWAVPDLAKIERAMARTLERFGLTGMRANLIVTMTR